MGGSDLGSFYSVYTYHPTFVFPHAALYRNEWDKTILTINDRNN